MSPSTIETLLKAVQDHVSDNREGLIVTLQELVRIPSINPAGATTPSREAVAALNFVLDQGRRLGFTAQSLHEQAGFLQMGPADAAETLGVLAHVDVVPPGEGWSYPPFSGEIVDGHMWGRGTEDDKGPAVSVLYAMAALHALDVPLRRKVRLILGTMEECGDWSDIRLYGEEEGAPTLGFTPDADFPVICGEKGILNVTFSASDEGHSPAEVETKAPAYAVLSLHAGSAPNIVPSRAVALLIPWHGDRDQALRDVQHAAGRFQQRHPQSHVQVLPAPECASVLPRRPAEDDIAIIAHGVEAHGAMPWDGHNALQDLANFLAPLPKRPNAPARMVDFLARRLGFEWDGASLGIAARHAKLGPTTVNAGVARTEDGLIHVTLNLRPTPPHTAASLKAHLQAVAKEESLGVSFGPGAMDPLFADEAGPLVTALKEAYQLVTGKAAPCAYVGGTTYAKAFPNMVAFGPLMPGEPMLAHQVDERVSLESLLRNAAIYALAIYLLAR